MKRHAYYSKKAADAFLSGDIDGCMDFLESATSYTESASEHLDTAQEYAERYKEEIENAPSPTPKKIPTPSIIIDSDRDCIPDDYDYAPKDPNVQTKEDVKTPGFGAILAIVCAVVVGYFAIRRRK